MAHTRSAMKQARSSLRRRARNQVYRSRARTYVRQARSLIEAGQFEQAQEAVRLAASALDKAAQKKVIHKNNAARRKSRLMRMLNKAVAAAQA